MVAMIMEIQVVFMVNDVINLKTYQAGNTENVLDLYSQGVRI